MSKFENTFNANLYDLESNKIHEFSVTETYMNNELFFNFKFVRTKTQNLLNRLRSNKVISEFETLSKTDSVHKISMKIYQNAKKKKVLMDYTLDIKPGNQKLFHAFRFVELHPYEFYPELDYSHQGIVINAVGKNLSDNIQYLELKEIAKVNLELKVPIN